MALFIIKSLPLEVEHGMTAKRYPGVIEAEIELRLKLLPI
jgi:hypothetical protein